MKLSKEEKDKWFRDLLVGAVMAVVLAQCKLADRIEKLEKTTIRGTVIEAPRSIDPGIEIETGPLHQQLEMQK